MNLEDLGYNDNLENYRRKRKISRSSVGRIVSQHRERYVAVTAKGECNAEVSGSLRFTSSDRSDFPVVGDWVSIRVYERNKGVITGIFPRKSIIQRQAVGKTGEKQSIAANIDFAFIVQAVDRDFNLNRLERYLTLCHASAVQPIVILSKTDLVDNSSLMEILEGLNQRIRGLPIIQISNETRSGYDELDRLIGKGKTYCLLGSSGVGKSTLMNNISGRARMKTDSLSASTGKGRHITSHRELFVLENGGILIDNPGMREVGIAGADVGMAWAFHSILGLSGQCKFRDCRHIQEAGCAILKALEEGEIDRDSYENYLKLEKEREHFESDAAEKRKKEREFGKMVKRFKKDRKLNQP